VLHEETKPPARFTESTLLSAMEGAGKLIDDEALREAMAERGLGTPPPARPPSKGSSPRNTSPATAATSTSPAAACA
jgi:hypothetical protein